MVLNRISLWWFYRIIRDYVAVLRFVEKKLLILGLLDY